MDFLWTLSLKAAVLVMVAWVASLVLRQASAAMRHTVWAAAIAGLAVLPALVFLMPAWPVGGMLTATWGVSANATAGARGVPWAELVSAIWAVGCLVSLTRLLRAAIALRVQMQRATPLGPGVLLGDWTGSPMTWGVRQPAILLPAAAARWPKERREVVLAHELAHIVRRDWLWQILARLVRAVYWFHPLVWFAVDALREEAERACDDRVLDGVKASDYAGHLVEIGRALRPAGPEQILALPMVRTPELEKRVTHILGSPRSRRPAGSRSRATVTMAAVLFVVPLAAMQKDSGKVYKLTGDMKKPVLIHKVEPAYTQAARDAKIQGAILASLVIDTEGNVASAQIVRGLDAGLDQNALTALRQWKFQPAMRKGKPVRVKASVEVNFKLK